MAGCAPPSHPREPAGSSRRPHQCGLAQALRSKSTPILFCSACGSVPGSNGALSRGRARGLCPNPHPARALRRAAGHAGYALNLTRPEPFAAQPGTRATSCHRSSPHWRGWRRLRGPGCTATTRSTRCNTTTFTTATQTITSACTSRIGTGARLVLRRAFAAPRAAAVPHALDPNPGP